MQFSTTSVATVPRRQKSAIQMSTTCSQGHRIAQTLCYLLVMNSRNCIYNEKWEGQEQAHSFGLLQELLSSVDGPWLLWIIPKWISPRPCSHKRGQPQTSMDVGPLVLGGSVTTDYSPALCFFYSSVMGTASTYCSQDLSASLWHTRFIQNQSGVKFCLFFLEIQTTIATYFTRKLPMK